MVDFLQAGKEQELTKELEELRLQRLAQMKELERYEIRSLTCNETKRIIRRDKDMTKEEARTKSGYTAHTLSNGLEKLKIYIKGQVVSGMKESYKKTEQKLKKL